LENRKICDSHVHLGRSNGINATLHLDEIDNFIEKFDIENLLLFPFELDTNEYNEKIKNLTKINKKIHGMYWIQKNQIEKDVKNLNQSIGDGYVGVKFHGTFENLPISDETYKPVLEVLNEKEALLLVHAGRFKDGDISSNTSYLHAVNVAKRYPKIKVILGHMGGNDHSVVKKALEASKNVKNIWFETSGITAPIRIEKAVEVIGPERILFGSDAPWCSFRSIFYCVEDSLLNEKIKNLIFYENFIKLLNL
jgi:predicted TIM-barrel fold metal-dependent hydrolase